MQNFKFMQIYPENQTLYQDLLPKWIDFIKEIDEHRNGSQSDTEIIHNLDCRVKIQGSRKDMHFELFYCDNELIGFANFAIDLGTIYGLIESGYGTVMGIYIVPEYRQKGNGKLFFEHIQKTLESDGAKYMYICPDLVTGEPFWSAVGFHDSGKIDPDENLPIYVKQLKNPE
ncbi:MAG: GNAT family N-acetyltransferase [Oscillospiraceae bacterium]|nr:GNAT family N-acetyltransferase [Oscillospiraceae bacterium]